MSDQNAIAAPPPVTASNVNEYAEKFIRLRDKVREMDAKYEEHVKPYKQMLLTLNSMLLDHLNQHNIDAVSINGVGTFYKTSRKSASIEDGEAFARHVIGEGAYELIDWKANATAVEKFLEENQTLPPGIKYTVTVTAGVRKSAAKG